MTIINPYLSTTSTGKGSISVAEAERSSLVADPELLERLRGKTGTIHRRMLSNFDQNQNQNDQQQNQSDQQQNQSDQQQNQSDQQQNQNDQQQNQSDQRQNIPEDATATAIPDLDPTGNTGGLVATQSSAKAIMVMGALVVVGVGII